MSIYRKKINPFTSKLQYVLKGKLVSWEEGVDTAGDLPSSGNVEGDARIANDNHHLYIWNGSAWVDEGDIIDIKWATLEDKPTSTVENIDDAVTKKHAQNTDTDLDATFEATFVKKLDTVNVLSDITSPGADIEDAVTKKHTQNTDVVLLSGGSADEELLNNGVLKSNLSVDALVKIDGRDLSVDGIKLDTIETSAVALATVKGDVDIADALTKKHTQNSDTKLDNGQANEVTSVDLRGHLDSVDNPHIVTVDQLDLASGTVASDVDDAIDKKHEHSNKTLLDTYTQTEVDIADAISKEHEHSNKTELDKLTDGDHDVRIDNPHIVTVDQLDLASGTVASDIDDAIDKKHTQNTDTGTSNNFDITGEISIKLYSQNDEPTLGQDNRMAIWIDTDDSNRVYLLYRRGVGDQVAVELA